MLPIYVGFLVGGGILIAVSVMTGGDADKDLDKSFDKDFDKDLAVDGEGDASADADGDAPADANVHADSHAAATAGLSWMPFLSLRFWTFGAASFGMTGTVLTALGTPQIATAPLSVVLGTGIGYTAAWTFKKLSREVVSGSTSLKSFIGQEGKVLLAVGPEKTGKIQLIVGGQEVTLPARTADDVLIERKQPVLVVDVTGGVATVTPLKQLTGAPSPEET